MNYCEYFLLYLVWYCYYFRVYTILFNNLINKLEVSLLQDFSTIVHQKQHKKKKKKTRRYGSGIDTMGIL